MTAEEYKNFTQAVHAAPQPKREAAAAAAAKIEQHISAPVREQVILPQITPKPDPVPLPVIPPVPEPEPEQTVLPMPASIPWRMVGELYNSYIIVEQGEEAFLIDKHAAHERILFEKLKANQEKISSQALLSPVPVRLSPEGAAELLANKAMLEELGFEIDEFGENTILVRQVPMDLDQTDAVKLTFTSRKRYAVETCSLFSRPVRPSMII